MDCFGLKYVCYKLLAYSLKSLLKNANTNMSILFKELILIFYKLFSKLLVKLFLAFPFSN